MRDTLTGVIGLLGCVTSIQLTEWVGLICTLLITLTTCGIQVYRLIRDRDTDKQKQIETKGDNKDNENI